MTDRRLSYLADMLVQHIIYRRMNKALLIAQYLRQHYGNYLVIDLRPRTGYRERAW